MANGGAIVAIDPRNGEIRALASNPTYPAARLRRPAEPCELARLVNQREAEAANFPSINRVTQGLYPPGSTWKPLTALAAMQEHTLAPYSTVPCTSTYIAGRDRQVFRNWEPNVNAAMTLPTALGASCDTYFYKVGEDFYKLPPERGQPLQAWAHRLGFGRPTGIDVGPEEAGLVPTIAWKRQRWADNEIEKLWKPGDSIQLAIGQKDLLVTPLQMAVFYSFVANGGKLVKPHVASRIEESGDEQRPADRPAQPGAAAAALAERRPGRARRDPRRPLQGDARELRHASSRSSAPSRSRSPARRAPRRRAVTSAATSTTSTSRGSAATARPTSPSWSSAGSIENGGFGGAVAAPATAKVFAKYFGIDSYVASAEAAD